MLFLKRTRNESEFFLPPCLITPKYLNTSDSMRVYFTKRKESGRLFLPLSLFDLHTTMQYASSAGISAENAFIVSLTSIFVGFLRAGYLNGHPQPLLNDS
jgi:hypothetical protein